MDKIKAPSVSGTFYTDKPDDLKKQIKSFKENSKNLYTEKNAKAVIVPHAGLVFSGRLAWEGLSQLDNKNIKTIFIFAPAHKVGFVGLALSNYEKWETPLGKVSIDKDICDELVHEFNAHYNDSAFEHEHSIEVQLPLLQSIYGRRKFQIVPVLIGRENPRTIEKIIRYYYEYEEIGFVISSDLSHFLPDNNARALDFRTAQMIETGYIQEFKYEQACGAVGIAGLVEFANKNDWSLLRIDMTNSSSTTGDKSSVVGYGSWFLYEGKKNDYIAKYNSDFVINTVKTVIESSLKKTNVTINYPQIFDELGACFVTLEKNDKLRGCIGSIIAHQPLINDLVNHSRDAAFNDNRFNPVQEDELKDIKVAVSILTHPVKIDFLSEDDLLEKIVPKKDGIIIRDGNYQAVYLPSVWEEIPEKSDFLNSLKIKAGLNPTHFSPTFEAYRFETTYIKE